MAKLEEGIMKEVVCRVWRREISTHL